MAILSFLHPGLERFAKTGDSSGIRAEHSAKLIQLLALLSFSAGVIPALRQLTGFHSVKRKYRHAGSDVFAVKVNKSWRLTFQISDQGDIFDVDYVQYH